MSFDPSILAEDLMRAYFMDEIVTVGEFDPLPIEYFQFSRTSNELGDDFPEHYWRLTLRGIWTAIFLMAENKVTDWTSFENYADRLYLINNEMI